MIREERLTENDWLEDLILEMDEGPGPFLAEKIAATAAAIRARHDRIHREVLAGGSTINELGLDLQPTIPDPGGPASALCQK